MCEYTLPSACVWLFIYTPLEVYHRAAHICCDEQFPSAAPSHLSSCHMVQVRRAAWDTSTQRWSLDTEDCNPHSNLVSRLVVNNYESGV